MLLELVLGEAHLFFLLLVELPFLLFESSLDVDAEFTFLAEIGHGFLLLARQNFDLSLHLIDLGEKHLEVVLLEGCLALDHLVNARPKWRQFIF